MSGEQYYFCPECFDSWQIDPFDYKEKPYDPKCSCGATALGGSLGTEGEFAHDILRDISWLYEREEGGGSFLKKVFKRYFKLDCYPRNMDNLKEEIDELLENCNDEDKQKLLALLKEKSQDIIDSQNDDEIKE